MQAESAVAAAIPREPLACRFADAVGLVVSALDEVAWLFNLRGGDIEYNPVFISYALITLDSATLYTDPRKITEQVTAHLGECLRARLLACAVLTSLRCKTGKKVQVKPYDSIFGDLRTLSGVSVASSEAKAGSEQRIWLDPNKCNVALLNSVDSKVLHYMYLGTRKLI